MIGTGRLAARRQRKAAGETKKTPRWQTTLSKGTARSTFLAGIVLSFPGASYLAALDQIHKQNLSTAGIVATVSRST